MKNRREFSSILLAPAICTFFGGGMLSSTSGLAATISNASAIKSPVHNRGRPPQEFLEILIEWGRTAPEEVFSFNNNYDVYSHVKYKFGSWKNEIHRKAVMLEVLRVLGGFESSWNWNAGVDVGKIEPNTICTEEAGLFQCSGNSMNFDESLKNLLRSTFGKVDCKSFILATKSNKPFAIEYCARLLRYTVKHHGPLKRKSNNPNNPRKSSIHPYFSLNAVQEFEAHLSQ